MNHRKRALIVAGCAAAAVVVIAAAAVLILQSGWFEEKVRSALIGGVESATGGRAELGSFQFDWRQMRVAVRDFVLHGNEPPDKPPLIRAASVEAGLTVVSFLEQKVDVRYLDIQGPQVYLIVYPDGHTNVPEPRIKKRGERTPLDTLLNAAVGRFNVQNGILEIEGRSRTPFSARGRNLNTKFLYDPAARRYQGDVSIQPVELQWDGRAQELGIRMALTLEKDRIGISPARLEAGNSQVDFSGAIQDLVSPRAAFRYEARVSAADVNRVFHLTGLERGTAELAGNAEWAGGFNYSITGNLLVRDGAFRQASWRVQNVRAEAAVRADQNGIQVRGLRFSGESAGEGTRLPLEGQARELTVRGQEADARELAIEALGGRFSGTARLRAGNQFEVQGDFRDLEAKRAVAVYSREPLPWDSLISGHVEIAGAVRQPQELRAAASLTLAPAPQGPPVSGQVVVRYDRKAGTLELDRSTLTLPASRIQLSGAIGRQLRVQADTRDLNDFLAALGESSAAIPVKLENGSAVFDGTISGSTESPRIAGRLTLTRFAFQGKLMDSLRADVAASPQDLRLQNAVLARGSARAQFQFSAGLHDWKISETSPISGSGSVRDAMASDLLTLFQVKGVTAAGTGSGSGQISGTAGSPQWSASLQVVNGSVNDEPFDRISGQFTGTAQNLTLSSGQLSAGVKQVQFSANFNHPANRFDTGQVDFRVQSNPLPVAEIRTLAHARPGLEGMLQFTASGRLQLLPPRNAGAARRLTDLQAEIAARGVQLSGQSLGDMRLTANSQGAVLRTRLDTTFNGSAIRGSGEWRMDGDYPGNAEITFNRLDLAGLRSWIAPSAAPRGPSFTGFAEGEVRVAGPLLKPQLLTAELRVPALEIRPASGLSGIVLRNAGPLVATMANSVITIGKADLTGRSTDVTLAGKIALNQRNPLDLRVSGHADLALLKTFNPDIDSSGKVTLDASVRGSLATPQVNGRLELSDGQMSYGMFPNGITDANGVILFTGDRATIQSLQAGTGGGTIQVSGFTGYNEDGVLLGLHAVAKQVRVRYPEGISTVSDATLDLTGSPDRSMLTGTVIIRRATINVQSDLGTLLAKSAEPVRTPAARTGLLAGLNYDLQIETAPDVEIQSALTQGIEADANLRLRGTAAAPALLGRIRITQGQLLFFGTRYTINQGSISFFNALKIEPVLDIDLETRARGIDITITIAGPLNKLTMTPRSDPPLQFNEIISVLTTGEAPSAALTRFGQQATAPQTSQQTAATALLGQVIANPVSGRLQRFFGISRLRINPTLDPALASGVQYTPQARLTLEQQVTPDITFTYITDLSNANAQIVSVEWAVNKQWSVVAQREENGLVGLDFFWKKRFR